MADSNDFIDVHDYEYIKNSLLNNAFGLLLERPWASPICFDVYRFYEIKYYMNNHIF